MQISLSNNITFDTNSSVLSFDGSTHDDEVSTFLKDDKLKKFNNTEKIIRTINLIPTMMCDGACSYCYNIDEINNIKSFMSPTKFEDGVNNINEKGYILDLHTLRLYGGEPLLNPNLAELIIHIKETHGFEILYISSGLLFNDKKFNTAKNEIKRLIEYGIDVTIGVSVDFGLTDEQFTRVSNKATINKQILLNRCQELEAVGTRIVYATIISRDTNIEILKQEVVKHYTNKKEFFKLSSMDVLADRKFAYRISVANSDDNHPSMDQVQELYEMYNDLYKEVALTSNLYPYSDVIYAPDVHKLDDDNFLFLYESNYCGIFSDMITMLPDGNLTSCHMTPEPEALDITEEQYNYYFKNEKCNACDFYNVCRGLCVNRNLQAPEAMDVYCKWAMLSFELALKRSFIVNGGSEIKFKLFLKKVQI